MRIKLLSLLLVCMVVPSYAQTYIQALPGYTYQFPRDNFSHPEYQTEWWYYTGNLVARDGHRFGFELTFFRQGVTQTPGTTPWYVNDLYMAHFGLSDISGKQYYSSERLNRAGPGVAGVDAASGTVWNANWSTVLGQKSHRLRGLGDHFSFDLEVTPEKPPVIHGTDGVSQKGEGVGHASHYISFTRMQSAGAVTLNGADYQVTGDSWMDHEFFSDSMNRNEVGWDWLSVQLNDNSELMLYRLRHRDGTVDPYSSGTYVDAQGKAQHLALHDFSMTQSGSTYTSRTTGATYPIAWSVAIPALKLQLAISTPLDRQEFVSRFGPSYWEGAVDITGQRAGSAVKGSGYLEMTGYADKSGTLFPSTSTR